MKLPPKKANQVLAVKMKLTVVAAVAIVAGLWGASASGWRDGIAGGTLLALFADGLLAQRS